MDGRPNRRNKAAFSNFSGVVWTMPKQTRTVKATRTSLNKRFNKQNNGYARAS